MIDRSRLENSFEFVILAGARARQLMKGSVPRVTDEQKPVKIAQAEIFRGKVQKVEGTEPGGQKS